MGLITFNGLLLMADGGLASSKDCCCGSRNCYCFTRSYNYVTVERWRVCYRDPVWDSTNSVWIYPDGMPCDGGSNGQVCPPGSLGRSVTMSGNIVQFCSCGSGGTSYSVSIITSQSQYDACSPISPPP